MAQLAYQKFLVKTYLIGLKTYCRYKLKIIVLFLHHSLILKTTETLNMTFTPHNKTNLEKLYDHLLKFE